MDAGDESGTRRLQWSFAVMSFVVRGDRIVEIDVYNDPQRVAEIAAPVMGPRS